MKLALKIAHASCNQTGGDWPRNIANICRAIDLAAEDGADILALEELGLTGYDCGDNFFYTDNAQIAQMLKLIADHAAQADENLIVSVGHPWRFADKNIPDEAARRKNPLFNRLNNPFNVQSLIAGGKIVAMSAKRYLYNYGRGYEKRHFEEWNDAVANQYQGGSDGAIMIDTLEFGRIPFGSPVVQFWKGAQKINVTHVICEECWIGSRFDGTYNDDRDYARDNPMAQKAKVFDITVALNPNASPPSTGKIDVHRHLSKLGAKHCGVFVHTDGLGSSGSSFAQFGSRLMAQKGKIISEGQRLSFKDVAYTSRIVMVNAARGGQKPHAAIPHVFKNKHTPAVQDGPAVWDKGEYRDFEEELRCECLWLFDYLRKNKTTGVSQALSGGADSAYNAVKIRLMVEIGFKELGVDGFLNTMSHLPYLQDVRDAHAKKDEEAALEVFMQNFLTCVYLRTENNSDATRRAARELTAALGGVFHDIDMQPLLNSATKVYARGVKGVAHENLQARLRQVMIMLFANTENKIAIANPNLDEARNSYATWGGDLHGGMISGNAHKDKALELEHLRLLSTRGLHGLPPVKGLRRVLKNKPSAELQPKSKDGKVVQESEKALGRSFAQMRVIARHMLYARRKDGRKNNPTEVFLACRKDTTFHQDSIEVLHDKILLSYQKWGHAQFKIHASPIAMTYGENVDHQSSLRTPNISANHAPELAQMTLYCLSLMAKRDGIDFKTLTGGLSLKEASSRALIDKFSHAAFIATSKK